MRQNYPSRNETFAAFMEMSFNNNAPRQPMLVEHIQADAA